MTIVWFVICATMFAIRQNGQRTEGVPKFFLRATCALTVCQLLAMLYCSLGQAIPVPTDFIWVPLLLIFGWSFIWLFIALVAGLSARPKYWEITDLYAHGWGFVFLSQELAGFFLPGADRSMLFLALAGTLTTWIFYRSGRLIYELHNEPRLPGGKRALPE